MASHPTEALVLRSVDFGESDRILHLLVPDGGRLTAIAKGARRSVKRFSGTLDLFNHLRIQVWQGRGMARLEQATLLTTYTPLRGDPARFALACYLLELIDRLAPEGGAHADTRRLFAFALGAHRAVATRVPDARLRTLLELRALHALGLRPELSVCVRCGSALGAGRGEGAPAGGALEFCIPDGGVVCARCGSAAAGAVRVHLGTLRALDQALRLEPDALDRLALPPAALREARELLSRFQRFHVGVELKSEKFLEEVLGGSPAAA